MTIRSPTPHAGCGLTPVGSPAGPGQRSGRRRPCYSVGPWRVASPRMSKCRCANAAPLFIAIRIAERPLRASAARATFAVRAPQHVGQA